MSLRKLLLFFLLSVQSVNAQSVEDEDFLLTVVESFYINNYHVIDTARIWNVQFGLGSSYFTKKLRYL